MTSTAPPTHRRAWRPRPQTKGKALNWRSSDQVSSSSIRRCLTGASVSGNKLDSLEIVTHQAKWGQAKLLASRRKASWPEGGA